MTRTVSQQRLDAAEEEVRRLAAAQATLVAAAREARQALEDAQDVAAVDTFSSALDGTPVSVDDAAVSSAQALLTACERAVALADTKRTAAILNCYKVRAGVLRSQAEEIRAEVIDRQKITAEFLADLEAFEGCKYAPAAVGRLIDTGQAVSAMTRTQSMVAEAESLEAQARELEHRQVNRNGTAVGATVAEVLENAAADPFVIAPPLDVLERKANELVEAERRRRSKLEPLRSGYVPLDAPLVIEVVWVDHEVVDRRCRVTTPPQAVPA